MMLITVFLDGGLRLLPQCICGYLLFLLLKDFLGVFLRWFWLSVRSEGSSGHRW